METHVTECIPLLCSSFLLLQWRYTEHEPDIRHNGKHIYFVFARNICMCVLLYLLLTNKNEGSNRGYTTSILSQYDHRIGPSIS